MITTVNYTREELLDCQLFVASKSKRLKKNRFKNRVILVSLSFFCALMFYIGNNDFFMYYSLVAGIVFLLFYPFYQRYLYKKHYRKFVDDKFKGTDVYEYTIDITPKLIHTISKIGELSINTAQINSITETEKYFFIKLTSEDVLSLPKRCFDYQWLSTELLGIAKANNISIIKELDWKWR